jgi:2-polyprenyl-6-methoxyphenol hydroxylase-like FAD-dependent oxidoreductase
MAHPSTPITAFPEGASRTASESIDSEFLETDVLIVGAGPVGLSLALEIATQGRRCIVVERNTRVGLAPRAKTTNVRSRELLRRWGIAGRLAAQSPLGVAYPSDVVFATRLAGQELARFKNAFYCSPVRDERFSEHAQWIPQYKVEQVLMERLQELPQVRILFATELHAFEQAQGHVRASLKRESDHGGGKDVAVKSRFLVGADGARSTVRRLLGIGMEGTSPLSHHINVIFRSEGLDQQHGLGSGVMYWLVNNDTPATVSPMDRNGIWAFGCPASAIASTPIESVIRSALGLDVPIEILSQDEWTSHRLIAKQYAVGQVFLAGDACHLHPPYGGYGMNMGIGDALDLGWKMGAVLSGWGALGLLQTYEHERRQVHQRTIDESVRNHAHMSSRLSAPGIEDKGPVGDTVRAQVGLNILEHKRREFDSLGVVLGSRYQLKGGPPIDLRPPQEDDPSEYKPLAAPGCLAPHAWLSSGTGAGASLYDHFAVDAFTLLVLDASALNDAQAFTVEAARLGIPLSLFVPAHPLPKGLYPTRLALVRPDQYLHWCGDSGEVASVVLAMAVGRETLSESQHVVVQTSPSESSLAL